MQKRFLLVILVLCLVAAASPSAAAPLYKNGDVAKIIVPWAAGGGFDRVIRLMQPYLEAELRKSTQTDVTIIVENLTGAGGLLGQTTAFKAKPDGLTMVILGFGSAAYQHVATDNFDVNQFGMLGLISSEPYLIPVIGASLIDTFPEMLENSKQKSTILATGGQGGAAHIDSLLAQRILQDHGYDWRMSFVHYDGGSPALFGIVKGEVDSHLSQESNTLAMINEGELKPIVLWSMKRGDILTDVPILTEQGISQECAEQLSLLASTKILAVPPGMDEAHFDLLSRAFQNVMEDLKFIETVKNANLPLQYLSPEGTSTMVRDMIAMCEKYQDVILPVYQN